MNRALYSFIFFLLIIFSVFPESEIPTFNNASSSESSNVAMYSRAIGSAVLSNLVLFSFNRFVTKKDYAMISCESIKANLNSSWVWDQDEFSVNHIGHPYQGSFYYIAGRSNELGFIPSSLITVGNSILWELFLETETPSRNDLIATSLGGIALGEILHRASVATFFYNIPIAITLSPMDGFTIAITPGKSAPSPHDTSFSFGQVSFGAGIVRAAHLFENGLTTNTLENEPLSKSWTLNLMADATYGSLFGVPTLEPFSQFELTFSTQISPSYYSVVFLSDGVLLAGNLFPLSQNNTTLALSLHYDLVYSKSVNFSANSIGLSWKTQKKNTKNRESWIKLHANWVVLGANDYVYLRVEPERVNQAGEERRDYDLGTGLGLKFSTGLSFSEKAFIEIGYSGYGMRTIPASVPDGGSDGYTLIGIGSLQFEQNIKNNLYSGIALGFWHKQGIYQNAPDVNEQIGNLNMYIRKSLLN